MNRLPALQHQIDELQQQHQDLLHGYATLNAARARQQTEAKKWRDKRTLELQADAHQRLRAETLQNVFYRMAEQATADLSFFDFSKVVHNLLNELIYAKNCYLCLYNPQKHTLDFPYYVDERDGNTLQCNDVPYRRGLTEYVLRTGRYQLIDQARFQELSLAGEITQATGDLSFSNWLGLPLHLHNSIGGVLAVQSYDGDVRYTASDVAILGFFASHFSNAIERYQAVEELRKSEARYRTLIEKVALGVVVVQEDCMVFVNPSMVATTGYATEKLLGQPFLSLFHPDDKAEAMARCSNTVQPSFESGYRARVVRVDGKIRSLEFSEVRIQWSMQPASLLFAVDITERLQAEDAQRLALQEQTELNAMKSRFITMASHEFRTPLATIHGSVDLLRHYQTRLSADQKRLTLVKIDDAVQRMTAMLENVLLIGRADSGQLAFKPQALTLVPFLQGMFDDLQFGLYKHHKKVRLISDLPQSEPQYLLDSDLVRHIFGNLVSNALKYSPNTTQVTVAVCLKNRHLIVTVSDDGIGIPEGDLTHLFSNFHRAGNVGLVPGTGLGLSIVKDAVNLHGGDIQVTSQLGQGSCFTVRLPASECP
jgi:PAS domain S-box-containing protein